MTKIGVFADVHGYLEELKKTLDLLKHLEVDHMICAGDLVDKGVHNDAVVELMQALAIPCVQGNHDAKAQWTWLIHDAPLQQSSIDYLSSLPESLTFEWEGVTVYMSHSNPWQDSSIYVYPMRPMALFEEIANAVEANVIILGHTHMPMRIEVDGKLIINPGAVYGNVSTDSLYGKRETDQHTCGILSLPACNFDLYDINTGEKLAW